MIDSDHRFSANSPDVIHETIDNEAVIINLNSGLYYNLNETGTAVWVELMRGSSVGELVYNLSSNYNVAAADIEKMVCAFVAALQNDRLIIPSGPSAGTTSDMLTAASIKLAGGEFTTPLFNRFTDMTSLLVIDPVHDVDPTGWPNRA